MTEQAGVAHVYRAWLLREPSGARLALASDLAGCFAIGASDREALAGLVAAIPAYYAWLSQHDEYTPTIHGQVGVTVSETAELKPGEVSAFFRDDAEPVNDEDLDWLLAVLGWAYEDLLASAAKRPASPGLDAALSRVAAMQVGLTARTTGANAPDPRGGGAARIAAARDAALAVFRGTSARRREATSEEASQRWSLRRGLRESVLLARRATGDLARL